MSEINLSELIHKPIIQVNFDITPYQKRAIEKKAKATNKPEVYHFRKALDKYLGLKEETDTQVEQEA